MHKIRALNRISSGEDEVPVIRREAQEDHALEQYMNALRQQAVGNFEDAKQTILCILQDTIPQLEAYGPMPSSLSTLKYSCYYNIGNICLTQELWSASLNYYLQASALDCNDPTVWHRIGKLAFKLNRFPLAIRAFVTSVQCNERYWPSLEELVSLLYATGDTKSCLFFIGIALSVNKNHLKSLVLRRKIYKSNPWARVYYKKWNLQMDPIAERYMENFTACEKDEQEILISIDHLLDHVTKVEKSQNPSVADTITYTHNISEYSWLALGRSLIAWYHPLGNKNMQEENEMDDQEESNYDTRTRLSTQGKRKRDLLSDLQIWGWHSKRKYAKRCKPALDLTLEGTLIQIIPENLRKGLFNENESGTRINTCSFRIRENLNLIDETHKNPTYFGSESEMNDVITALKFEGDNIFLISNFVFGLSKLWNLQWPAELLPIYMHAFNMIQGHLEFQQLFVDDILFDDIRNVALAIVLYGELRLFSGSKFMDANLLHESHFGFLQLICSWKDQWDRDYCDFAVRFYWLRAHIYYNGRHNENAIKALEAMLFVIETNKNEQNDYQLQLLNCADNNVVNTEIGQRMLKYLHTVISLTVVEELFHAEKYPEVINILKATFHHMIDDTKGFSVAGYMARPVQLTMLLDSLWYTDVKECFIWTEACLDEALKLSLLSGVDVNTHDWYKVLEKCLEFMLNIIQTESILIVDVLYVDAKIRLVNSLCHIVRGLLIRENEHNASPILIVTPWILLHYILLREEHRKQAGIYIGHTLKEIEASSRTTMKDQDQTNMLSSSVSILFSAHEFLGPKGWCLVNNGQLLHFMLDAILDRLDTPIFENIRDKIDIHIEQAMFCLYQHPSKKNKISRHLADHNVDPLPLSWHRAIQLYEFHGPVLLPEFNSYKNASISADLEQLLQRILSLIPTECDPHSHVSFIHKYIYEGVDVQFEPLLFPYKIKNIYYLIGDYYFKQREFKRCMKYFVFDLCINTNRVDSWACLGLSFLSQLENKLNYCKALKSELSFLAKAKYAQRCFKKSLALDEHHLVLWIENGSFEYMVHSFCSRTLKSESDTLSMERFEYLENQKNSYLESARLSFQKAIDFYRIKTHGNDLIEADERWLQYYILGKVAEKQQREPSEYLKYYTKAIILLQENGAIYPEKINYHNPQHLSVEALEMHYRLNASILKYLELHEDKLITAAVGNCFQRSLNRLKCLKNFKQTTASKASKNCNANLYNDINENVIFKNDIIKCIDDMLCKLEITLNNESNLKNDTTCNAVEFSLTNKSGENSNDQHAVSKMTPECLIAQNPTHNDDESANLLQYESNSNIINSFDKCLTSSSCSSSLSSSCSTDSDSYMDNDSISSSVSSCSNTSENMTLAEVSNLMSRCIVGLEQCVLRLPQNYKALYRLAHLYFNSKLKNDLTKAKQLLLSEYRCANGITICGLFGERKAHNFFHGIWRIPSSEIDRPGSLSAHMNRCIMLLLQILRSTNDTKTLLDLYVQFTRIPDPDKVYIKDSDRLQFAEQALTLCLQSFRAQIHNVCRYTSINISASVLKDKELSEHLLLEIFRAYQRIQKVSPSKEVAVASMLSEVYVRYRNLDPSTSNILEAALKFCQHCKVSEKQKQYTAPEYSSTSKSIPIAAANISDIVVPAGLTISPVPSAISTQELPITQRMEPEKSATPPGSRPRGRPPLTKIVNPLNKAKSRLHRQKKLARTHTSRLSDVLPSALKTSSASGKIQSPSFPSSNFSPYNYIKHYQEELIKQYSQSLNLAQLTQFSQYVLSAGSNRRQLVNHLVQNPFAAAVAPATSNQLAISNQAEFIQKHLDRLNQNRKVNDDTLTSFAKTSSTSTSNKPQHSLFRKKRQKSNLSPASIKPISDTTISLYPSLNKAQILKSVFKYNQCTNISPLESNIRQDIESNAPVTSTSALIPSFTKELSSPSTSEVSTLPSALMKARPDISITPVVCDSSSSSSVRADSEKTYIHSVTSSTAQLQNIYHITSRLKHNSGKTLQEKLADKQKQQMVKSMSVKNKGSMASTNSITNIAVNQRKPSSKNVQVSARELLEPNKSSQQNTISSESTKVKYYTTIQSKTTTPTS